MLKISDRDQGILISSMLKSNDYIRKVIGNCNVFWMYADPLSERSELEKSIVIRNLPRTWTKTSLSSYIMTLNEDVKINNIEELALIKE